MQAEVGTPIVQCQSHRSCHPALACMARSDPVAAISTLKVPHENLAEMNHAYQNAGLQLPDRQCLEARVCTPLHQRVEFIACQRGLDPRVVKWHTALCEGQKRSLILCMEMRQANVGIGVGEQSHSYLQNPARNPQLRNRGQPTWDAYLRCLR